MNKNQKNKEKKNSDNKIVSQILSFFKNQPGQGFTAKQLVRKLNIKGKSRIELVEHTCLDLAQNNKLKKVGDLYQSTIDVQNTYVGKVDHVNARFAFIVCEDLKKKCLKPLQDLNLKSKIPYHPGTKVKLFKQS